MRSSSRTAERTSAFHVELALVERALASGEVQLGEGAVGLVGRSLEGVGGHEPERGAGVREVPRVLVGGPAAEAGEGQGRVELGQQVLLGQGEAAARVVDLVPDFPELDAVFERPDHEGLERLRVRGYGVHQGHRRRLEGIAGGQGKQRPELLLRRLEGGFGAHERVLGLRGLKLGAEDVELAGEAHLETCLGGLQQALAALQALTGHREELPLRDHVVESTRGLDGQPLSAELEERASGFPGPSGCS